MADYRLGNETFRELTVAPIADLERALTGLLDETSAALRSAIEFGLEGSRWRHSLLVGSFLDERGGMVAVYVSGNVVRDQGPRLILMDRADDVPRRFLGRLLRMPTANILDPHHVDSGKVNEREYFSTHEISHHIEECVIGLYAKEFGEQMKAERQRAIAEYASEIVRDHPAWAAHNLALAFGDEECRYFSGEELGGAVNWEKTSISELLEIPKQASPLDALIETMVPGARPTPEGRRRIEMAIGLGLYSALSDACGLTGEAVADFYALGRLLPANNPIARTTTRHLALVRSRPDFEERDAIKVAEHWITPTRTRAHDLQRLLVGNMDLRNLTAAHIVQIVVDSPASLTPGRRLVGTRSRRVMTSDQRTGQMLEALQTGRRPRTFSGDEGCVVTAYAASAHLQRLIVERAIAKRSLSAQDLAAVGVDVPGKVALTLAARSGNVTPLVQRTANAVNGFDVAHTTTRVELTTACRRIAEVQGVAAGMDLALEALSLPGPEMSAIAEAAVVIAN